MVAVLSHNEEKDKYCIKMVTESRSMKGEMIAEGRQSPKNRNFLNYFHTRSSHMSQGSSVSKEIRL